MLVNNQDDKWAAPARRVSCGPEVEADTQTKQDGS